MNTMLGLLLIIVTAPPAPLTADQATVDRGDINGGTVLKQTFTVKNTTAEAISIAGLDSGCGCLRKAISKNELKPSETAEVSLDINTLTQPDGPQTWLLKVRYRPASLAKASPDEVLELRMSAKLSRVVSVTPPMISVSTEAEATTSITLTDTRAKPFAIAKLTTTSQHITAKQRSIEKNGTFTIDLAIADALPVGTHDEMVIVHTTDSEYAELKIPARIVKRGKNAVNAYPESLDIDTVAGGGSGIVQFRRSGGKAVAIASAECARAGVTVTSSTGSGSVATIKVVVSPKVIKSGKAEVKVKFSEPADTELIVPVKWSSD